MTGLTGLRLLACAIAVCGPTLLAPARAAEAPHVRIANFSFEPETLEVKAGTTVVFENDDDIPHQIVADDHSFRSKALDTGDTYAFTFSKPGDFAYFCGLHPHMRGKITVSP